MKRWHSNVYFKLRTWCKSDWLIRHNTKILHSECGSSRLMHHWFTWYDQVLRVPWPCQSASVYTLLEVQCHLESLSLGNPAISVEYSFVNPQLFYSCQNSNSYPTFSKPNANLPNQSYWHCFVLPEPFSLILTQQTSIFIRLSSNLSFSIFLHFPKL